MKLRIKILILLFLSTYVIYSNNHIDSALNQDINYKKDTLNKRIEILEIKSNNYESLLSMQGAFYQTLIAIFIFVFGFVGWAIVKKQIKQVRIDNDKRIRVLKTVLIKTLGDINNILGINSYESNNFYSSFLLNLQSAKYLFESLNIYNGEKSIMNFLEDKTKDTNIKGITGNLIISLEKVEIILKNHILKGEFDKEIADDYFEITTKLDELMKCSNSVVSNKSKIIFDSIVKHINDKQLMNT